MSWVCGAWVKLQEIRAVVQLYGSLGDLWSTEVFGYQPDGLYLTLDVILDKITDPGSNRSQWKMKMFGWSPGPFVCTRSLLDISERRTTKFLGKQAMIQAPWAPLFGNPWTTAVGCSVEGSTVGLILFFWLCETNAVLHQAADAAAVGIWQFARSVEQICANCLLHVKAGLLMRGSQVEKSKASSALHSFQSFP